MVPIQTTGNHSNKSNQEKQMILKLVMETNQNLCLLSSKIKEIESHAKERINKIEEKVESIEDKY